LQDWRNCGIVGAELQQVARHIYSFFQAASDGTVLAERYDATGVARRPAVAGRQIVCVKHRYDRLKRLTIQVNLVNCDLCHARVRPSLPLWRPRRQFGRFLFASRKGQDENHESAQDHRLWQGKGCAGFDTHRCLRPFLNEGG
jgi:hypothetical protein